MTLEELAQRVQVLEDIEAIKKLKARYCAAADGRDEEAFVGCFAGDATQANKNRAQFLGVGSREHCLSVAIPERQ